MKKLIFVLLFLSNTVFLFSQIDSLKIQFELIKTNELDLNDSAIFEVSGLHSKAFMFEPIEYNNIPNIQLCPSQRDTIINSKLFPYMGKIIPLDSNLYLVSYRYRSGKRFFTDTCTIVRFLNMFAAFPIDEYKPEEISKAVNEGKMWNYGGAFFPASTDDRHTAYVCKLENGTYLIYGD